MVDSGIFWKSKGGLSQRQGCKLTNECTPYNIGGKAVIVGDAAHAMVPFFGQGMNCGFEDILVLDEIFSRYTTGIPSLETMEQILQEYTKIRHPDAGAICELALQNYITMRSSVVDPLYKLRKHIENGFYRLFPTLVVPLYSMVIAINYRYLFREYHMLKHGRNINKGLRFLIPLF